MAAVVCLAYLCLLLPLASRAIIQIKPDGGYEDIMVAIHPSVDPDDRIIENIKALFENASVLLHASTKGLVHFKQVTISIPNTWPQRHGAERVSSDLFKYSDVRVDRPNPYYGSVPYTLQPRRCGEPGEYIHLTSDFLVNGTTPEERPDVTPAFQLLQQWAHYRYGVFEDYGIQGDNMYPIFYCTADKVRANTFPHGVPFYPKSGSGTTCSMYRNCKVSKDCVAASRALDAPTAQSSALFMPEMDGNPQQYDIFTPTKQNILCRQSSALDVVRRHTDFKGLSGPRLSNVISVSFREVQQSAQSIERVVMVLDVSISMKDHERLDNLKRSATYFVRNLAPDSLQLAIVTFSRGSTVLQDLVTVDSYTRQGLVELIGNLTLESSTAIGQGLQTALQVLQRNGSWTEGTSIILMTDGEENVEPYIGSVLPSLVEAKVTVNGLGLGADADQQLETLADVTGGRVFFFKDNQENIELGMESAFEDSAARHLEEYRKPIVVLEESLRFTNRSELRFTIDDDLGNDTVVTVVSRTLEDLDITPLEPSGQPCSTCANMRDNTLSKRMTIAVPTPAKSGTWTLVTSCRNTHDVQMSVRVSSKAKSKEEEPILVRAFLNRATVKQPEDARIYADLSKGKDSVVRATVLAKVARPNDGDDVEVELLDNGLGADVTADDGIYSSYFTQFTGKGRYSVQVRVENRGPASLLRGRKGSGAVPPFTVVSDANSRQTATEFPRSAFRFIDEDIAKVEGVNGARLPEFQRFANGGSFRLENNINAASFPLSAIRDLSIIDEEDRANGYVVTLSWTSPGQFFNVSKGFYVEIRASNNLATFLQGFESGTNVSTAGILPADSRQEFAITLPKEGHQSPDSPFEHTVYIAARVRSRDGLMSDPSNIVYVRFYSTLVTRTGFTVNEWLVLLAPCIAFLILVILLSILSCIKLRPRQISRPFVTRQQSAMALIGKER